VSGPGRGLVLFFSYRVSLATWAARGLLDREVELYRRLVPAIGPTAFVTYGGRDDERSAQPLGDIRVLPNRWGLPAPLMSLLAPLLYRREIAAAAVLKTNQASGAWTAVLAKWLTGRPLVVRCGYVWSVNHARESRSIWRSRLVFGLERLALRAADLVIVTSEAARDHLVSAHGLRAARVAVIPNHVDTQRFAPPAVPSAREPRAVGFVGRLAREKNVAALVHAMAGLPGTRLVVAGDGPLRAELEVLAHRLGRKVEFLGAIPNAELPGLLARLCVFALPSLYEWAPKSLLEAMAAGVPVVAADVPGVRELVRHGETGWLTATDAGALRASLERVLDDPALRTRLADAARRHVVLHHSIERVVEQERRLLAAVADGVGPPVADGA
jgi:glycosyltransferase involved in cell wall biosynthesis